ncbi:uncharacterized protein IL334_004245 [Kwoniella shivajii]|uniref:AN1-type domain-containing protein n=1 Tax=Kwoniella shivajii TaxID=564305 RepID=A0ABZ1CZX1_9TREE|nr:hypothetical protein IL334_004245 [Kwoniella shivajii]
MSRTPSPTNKAEMMFLGKECRHPACHLHDFLPFSCSACQLSFCQLHFLPSQHSCAAPLPASMIDRIAPQCPMCNEIVPYPKSLDPNEAVEKHILSGTCAGFEGGEERKKAELKRKREKGEICWRKGCGKKLVVKMQCDQCKHDFCPTHRHSSSHSCTPSNTPSSSNTNLHQSQNQNQRPAGKAALSRLLPPSMTPPMTSTASAIKPPQQPIKSYSSQPINPPIPVSSSASKPLDAKAAAATAAIKRAGQDVKVPFVKTKTEKRSQAEINSTIQALRARHNKGLLTKAEEIKYAELVGEKEAGKRKIGGDKKDGKGDCIIA